MLWAFKGHSPGNFRNFQRITAWLAAAAAFWLAGGLASHELRLTLWLVALAIEYVGPSAGYFVPGLGRSTTTDWDIAGGHMAERCGLFIIIALGESVLVTGATFAELEWNSATLRRLFQRLPRQRRDVVDLLQHRRGEGEPHDRAIRRSRPRWAASPTPTCISSSSPASSSPRSPTSWCWRIRWATRRPRRPPPCSAARRSISSATSSSSAASRPGCRFRIWSGFAALAALVPAAPHLTPLLLGAAASGVLVVVAIWETLSLRVLSPADAGA